MNVAIVSDTHFGFKWGAERGMDAFRNAQEAFERTRDADLVILPGDIFDNKVPKQEVLDRATDCFNIYRRQEPTVSIADDSPVDYRFDGTAVVAIHGTHERRTQDYVNPIELMDTAGFLLHLHNETVIFEKGGERVAVHGMSGVPERYAATVLKQFDPEPVPDAYNIFVFHQSVKNFVYTDADHDVLTLEQLPDGFDLLVDGHIHWANLDHQDSDKPLIFPGSTITTQMNKIEAETPKGFVTVDTDTGETSFHELEHIRPLFYHEIDVSGQDTAAIMDTVATYMEDTISMEHELKPLVRIVLTGDTDARISVAEIRDRFADQAILSVTTRFSGTTMTGQTAALQQSEKSIAEMGRDLLLDKLEDAPELGQLFDLLAEEELEEAFRVVEEIDVSHDKADTDDEGSSTLADYAD